MVFYEYVMNSQLGLIWLACSATLIASHLINKDNDIDMKDAWKYLIASALALFVIFILIGIVELIITVIQKVF